MPIVWNEPLSFLQRFTENVIYSYLLDKADECTDPLMRMQVTSDWKVVKELILIHLPDADTLWIVESLPIVPSPIE
jgi:hypothetical protein